MIFLTFSLLFRHRFFKDFSKVSFRFFHQNGSQMAPKNYVRRLPFRTLFRKAPFRRSLGRFGSLLGALWGTVGSLLGPFGSLLVLLAPIFWDFLDFSGIFRDFEEFY